MLNFTETAIRLYRQILGSPERIGQLADGIETVLDGNTAIAVTEACISEVAALGGGFLEQGAALAWLSEQQRVTTNFFDEKLSVQHADSPRGALATAIGVTMSGHRSSIFLSAKDLSSCQDLLQSAVGRRLPLVIHLDNRLSVMQGSSSGSGHDALHQVMDSGCFVLFASNVQEAVDYTLIARHVAEITLTPAVVAVDGAETALAAQDVRLPSAELVKQFIGQADELIDSPSVAQKQLFSERRARLHRWHDLDKPVLQGALLEPHIFALGSAARKTYFEELIEETLKTAFTRFADLTNRLYSTLSTYALKKADIIVVAQGSAIETAKTLSDFLLQQTAEKKATDKINLGVIGLHSLRPFQSEKLVELLCSHEHGAKNQFSQPIVVLERMQVPLADDAPMMREIRAALHKKIQQGSPSAIKSARLYPVIYGLGGVGLNIADLLKLCQEIKKSKPGTFSGRYLGIPFTSEESFKQHPKRQVMLDTLQRYYPQINTLGVNARQKQLPLCSYPHGNVLGFAISHLTDNNKQHAFAIELSACLHKLKGGFLRSHIGTSWEQWPKVQTDYVIQSDKPYDTGKSSFVDFFMVLSAHSESFLSACRSLNHNGVLLFTDNVTEDTVLSESLKLIDSKNLSLYKVAVSERNQLIDDVSIHELKWEKTLATLMGVLINNDRIKLKSRKILSVRQSLLIHESEEKQNQLSDVFKNTLNALLDNPIPSDSHALMQYRSELVERSESIKTDTMKFTDIPDMVKNLGQAGETYDSLPRFWDQIGILHQSGESGMLTSDPYLATGTIPSLTATFNDISQDRGAYSRTLEDITVELPVFNPQDCTACGACWSNCPDSAIAAAAITPKALIETGIRLTGADALRSVSSKLASRMAKRCRNHEIEATNAGQLLTDAFSWLKDKSGLPEQRMQSIEADFEKVNAAIASLSIVASNSLFYAQEKKQNDSGELFSLVVNPDSCKGCGLCIELCASHNNSENQQPALKKARSEQSIYRLSSQFREQWKIWRQIPDTTSATIERMIQEQSMGTGAALMLSRYNAFSLSGGDHGELASGEKIAMRQLLSATEYHQQPLLHRFVSELERLRDELKKDINSSLSAALPTENLKLLSDRLSDVKSRQIDLNTLLDTSTRNMENSSIDVPGTHQLVKLVMQLNELHWKLSQGAYGLGRARYSLCITSSSIASWAGTFPRNPFHVPVCIDATGESAQVAAGMVLGQMSDILSAVSLMRQAKASVDTRYAKETDKFEQLEWQDLTHGEQQLCPPLLLVGGDDLLGAHGFSQISILLNSPYPIKIVVFNELDSGLIADGLAEYKLNQRIDSRNNLAMMAMSQRNAYVAQTSISDSSHFQRCVHELLHNTTAGLLSVYTPSPQRHGFKPEHTLRQAQLAVHSRMFPLFRYNPEAEGVFGSRLSLADEGGEINLTPAHWAVNEQRFQCHFSELEINAASAIELSDWLKLTVAEQRKKTPFIYKIDYKLKPESEQKYAVSKEFTAMIREQQHAWRTLQELAGIVTPFTDYVEQCVAERLSSEHRAELDALREEYEMKIAQINNNYENETHTKIRNQLLGLAGYDVNNLREH